MNSPLHQIAYTSRRSPDVDDDQIVDDIALPAYRKNRVLEITGCLWFDDEYFVQFIEGPRENITALFASILKDARHHDVRELVNRPIADRNFARFALRVVRDNEIDPVRKLIDTTFGLASLTANTDDVVIQIVSMTDAALEKLAQA